MALSLDQVKKKSQNRREQKPKERKAAEVAPVRETLATDALAQESKTEESTKASRAKLRPWSQRGLSRVGESRKSRIGADHHMNEDWMNLHEAPLFWIDLSTEAHLAAMEERLHDLERKIAALIRAPQSFVARARKRFRAYFK